MNESDVGKVFLFAMRWDWTFVGRFVRFVGSRIEVEQAGYFTRTGATFDALTTKGFTTETNFCPFKQKAVRIGSIEDINLLVPWEADWPQKKRG